VRADLSPRDLQVAVCADGGIPVTRETRAAIEDAGSLLRGAGADVETWTLPAIAEVPAVFSDWLIQPSLPAIVALYRGREDAMGPLMRGLVATMRPLSLDQFLEAWSARDALRRSLLDRMDRRRVVLMPVCSMPAFGHDQRGPVDIDGQRVDYVSTFGYSEIASIAALPALTVPFTRTPQGLPLGVQLVGRPFEEPLLLAVARVLEQAGGGYQRPPL
jgi:Asp-tRNA(Asn)/Glu-tRNA(Gln) amidotransferase A subunit family amidase